MTNAVRRLVPIVPHVSAEDVREEAARLVRVLYPGNLKRLGTRRYSVNRARQDGGALANTALMLTEAAALGATPEELLRVIVWLQSFVDLLRKEVDGSGESLRQASIAETTAEARQNPVQAVVTAGNDEAIPELIERTVELIAHQQQLLTVLRKRLEAA